MNRKFLATMRGVDVKGIITEGNFPFDTDDPISLSTINHVKRAYCASCAMNGIEIKPEHLSIYAVIPLEA